MEYHSDLENVDEDGYTQLNFHSQGITRRPVISEKGTPAASPPWRLIVLTLGILCLIMLVIAVVLGTTDLRSSSGSNSLKNDNFPSRNKENLSQPTRSPLEESVASTKALKTTGVFSSPCPPDWIFHEKSCYLLSMSLDSWTGSKSRCSQLGSNLLKIDSAEELTFIGRQVSSHPDNSFWIGLSRTQTEQPWLWEDGSTFSSNLFEIRSTAIQENLPHNCVWIHNSVVFDQLCTTLSYSICEKPSV